MRIWNWPRGLPQTSSRQSCRRSFSSAAAVAAAAVLAATLAAALAAAVDGVDREPLVEVLFVVDAEVAVARAHHIARAFVGPRRRQYYWWSKGQQLRFKLVRGRGIVLTLLPRQLEMLF